ncbi:MAG: PAS domain S-box protein [Acidobacteriales bacterium]|nr:PAS domain S-box protein [Terriglobales bacterium]
MKEPSRESSRFFRPSAPEMDSRLDSIMRSSLVPVAWTLAALYLVFAAAHTQVLAPALADIMVPVALTTALLLAGVAIALVKLPIVARHSHVTACFVLLLVLVNCALHLYLSGDPDRSTNFILLLLGAGLLLLRVPWLVMMFAATFFSWFVIARKHGFGEQWEHFGFAMLSAAVVSALTFYVRRQMIVRMETISKMERRSAQQAALERERFHKLADAAFEGIVIHEQGLIMDCNRQAALMYRATAEEMIGRPIVDFVAPFDREVMLQSLREPKECSFPLMALRGDGSVFPVEIQSRDLAGSGRHMRVVAIWDLTEKLKAERIQDEFISVVSHELRTPLTSIRGALALLKNESVSNNPEMVERMLGIAGRNSDRLLFLINDLLDLQRLATGQLPMRIRACDAMELVKQAVNDGLPFAGQQGVALEHLAETVSMEADPGRLLQTLSNLIHNAVKFSPSGSTVRVASVQQGESVMFYVRDEGRGIPADRLETIFERFNQMDRSDSRGSGGTGLGLSISRAIVNQHQGRIWAESGEKGSVFYFVIPRFSKMDRAESDSDEFRAITGPPVR